jgi:hypothetical protein
VTWDLRAEERESFLRAPAPERYGHLVKRCADWEEVWVLRNDQDWVRAERDGRVFMPVWPHPEYASACALRRIRSACDATLKPRSSRTNDRRPDRGRA